MSPRREKKLQIFPLPSAKQIRIQHPTYRPRSLNDVKKKKNTSHPKTTAARAVSHPKCWPLFTSTRTYNHLCLWEGDCQLLFFSFFSSQESKCLLKRKKLLTRSPGAFFPCSSPPSKASIPNRPPSPRRRLRFDSMKLELRMLPCLRLLPERWMPGPEAYKLLETRGMAAVRWYEGRGGGYGGHFMQEQEFYSTGPLGRRSCFG